MNKLLKILILIVIVVFFFPKPYISSPGFTPITKSCVGFSYLKNANEVAVDVQGESLCFGWLVQDKTKSSTEDTQNNSQNDQKVSVYVEKDTDGNKMVGSMGEQMRLVASTTIPATITYTIKYKSAAVVPNPKVNESVDTQTVSVNPGKTVLQVFTAIDAKVDVSYTYKEN